MFSDTPPSGLKSVFVSWLKNSGIWLHSNDAFTLPNWLMAAEYRWSR